MPRLAAATVSLVTLGLLVAACGAGTPPVGRVAIAGSTTLLPMISAVSGTFAAKHALVRMDVRMTGTSDGLALLCDGLVDIAGASRPISPREQAACAASRIQVVELVVAHDAVVLFTARGAIDVACLTADQIYGLMGPESTKVASWSAAGDVIRSAGEGLPDEPLSVIGPGISSGTRRVLVDLAIAPIAEKRGVAPALRGNYLAESSEQLILNSALNAPGALAFAGLATAGPWAAQITRLAVDFGGGCVEPSVERITDGTYPLSRSLAVYVNVDRVAASGAERAFIDELLSDAGLASAGAIGGVALSPAEASTVRARWSKALATAGAAS